MQTLIKKRQSLNAKAKTRLLTFLLILTTLLGACTGQNTSLSTHGHLQDVQVSLVKNKQWTQDNVNDIVWSDDSTQFAIAGSLTTEPFGITMYSIFSSKYLWFTETYVPFSVDYNFDEKSLVIPHFAGYELLDVNTGESIENYLHQDNTCFGSMDIEVLSNNRILSLGVYPKSNITRIYDWDMENKICLGIIIEENGLSFDFDTSQNNQNLVLMPYDIRTENGYQQEIHAWNIKDKEVFCTYSAVKPFSISVDGSIIVSGSATKGEEVEIWDSELCKPIGKIDTGSQPLSVDISPDGSLLVIGNGSTIQLWDISNQILLSETDKLSNDISIVQFSPDGKFLISVSNRIHIDDQAHIVLWELVP
jgi:WD domain, G-beta repeat